jgi:hypothetical protein
MFRMLLVQLMGLSQPGELEPLCMSKRQKRL